MRELRAFVSTRDVLVRVIIELIEITLADRTLYPAERLEKLAKEAIKPDSSLTLDDRYVFASPSLL